MSDIIGVKFTDTNMTVEEVLDFFEEVADYHPESLESKYVDGYNRCYVAGRYRLVQYVSSFSVYYVLQSGSTEIELLPETGRAVWRKVEETYLRHQRWVRLCCKEPVCSYSVEPYPPPKKKKRWWRP